jgi:hypothetical protein
MSSVEGADGVTEVVMMIVKRPFAVDRSAMLISISSFKF